jgi:ABC-type uncharacterized transport system permease subunit
MDINLNPWFIVGVSLFALSGLSFTAKAWLESETSLPKRIFDISLGFWGLLLLCWLFHTGGSGASRLWVGASALGLGTAYRLIASKIAIQSLGGSISAILALLAIFSYQLGLNTSMTHLAQGSSLPLSLVIHIILAMAGLVAFGVSSAMSSLYLVASKRLKSKTFVLGSSRLPSLSVLDAWHLKSLLIGFPLYTGALLIGSAYAFSGSGHLSFSYMIAIASWLIYGAVLQARLTAGWRGRRAAILTLVAFVGLLLVAASYSFR